jgi:ethanolamine ammonia-lyase small subunit
VSEPATPAPADLWTRLRQHTAARIGIGRAGGSVPTAALLEFQLAHARARDAVHRTLDVPVLETALRARHWDVLSLASAAADRDTFIRRPDLGRMLGETSRAMLEQRTAGAAVPDVVFVIADGLSALAIERHAVALLDAVRPLLGDWTCGPACIVSQGRVAVGDEVAARLGARLAVMLIGERPGLSSPDSLGLYLTWAPRPGRTNAERNCISNVRPEGLAYDAAARKLCQLMNEARRLGLTGVNLKDNEGLLTNTRPAVRG